MATKQKSLVRDDSGTPQTPKLEGKKEYGIKNRPSPLSFSDHLLQEESSAGESYDNGHLPSRKLAWSPCGFGAPGRWFPLPSCGFQGGESSRRGYLVPYDLG